MQTPVAIPMALTIFWVFVGIILSIIIPVAVIMVRGPKPQEDGFLKRVLNALKKYWGNMYVQKVLGAMIIACFLVFIFEWEFFKARDAVLAGISWESLLNKVLGGSGGDG